MQLLSRFILCILLCLLFAGCSPVQLPTTNNYLITAVPDHVVTRAKSHRVILVATPDALTIFNTTQMAYSLYPYHLAYFSKNQWAATPTQMLQPLLVQTLRNTHAFKAVLTPPVLGNYDYLLNTQILDLRQTFTHHQARVRVSIEATLSGRMGTRIIASKRFTIVLPMRCVAPYYGVISTNQAVEIILKKIAAFCVQHRGH